MGSMESREWSVDVDVDHSFIHPAIQPFIHWPQDPQARPYSPSFVIVSVAAISQSCLNSLWQKLQHCNLVAPRRIANKGKKKKIVKCGPWSRVSVTFRLHDPRFDLICLLVLFYGLAISRGRANLRQPQVEMVRSSVCRLPTGGN